MDAAATFALRAYGAEIRSFIGSRLRTPSDVDDAYSMFVEDLWSGLTQFSWRCSMRTWAYLLARNASIRYGRSPQRRQQRNLPLSWPGGVSQLVMQSRLATSSYQNTAIKDRFRQLREQLDPEDQTLLTLRVDRQLSYRDLALTMAGRLDLDDATLERERVRLRQAMTRIRRQLRRLGEAEGLLQPQPEDEPV
jgi:RNA polymerase sigma-70 factor (ECF subfamily)